MALFTIGHSTLSLAEFFSRLAAHEIDVLVDVRSSPYSRHVPEFNKESLDRGAGLRSVEYRYLGAELGGRPRNPEYLHLGQPDYSKMAQDSQLLSALEELALLSRARNVAMMCGEGNPKDCHRTNLLGRVLVDRFNVNIRHITTKGIVTQLDLLPQQYSLL